ncbi:hypothetical protein CC78DRAFT_512525 [Lojkania enalia]|uniref:Conserved oligomeric Golgi complex subunit 2 n=1 Tax=Lojkania enalia TaxID=147567 RepID=A0A9P4KDJ3_9PLEO|nr:hypothetical protein CC78DRAFT_512525 [Didymosphaeria enalia]
MSRFYFPDSASASDDDDTLPYPAPLQRTDFLAPDFSPSTYLSSLRNRHQTLEDLRTELRARSQLLSRELLDLVNSNYQDFLGLGRSLRGGDEKVEEVRVGLLGFRKEVELLKGSVVEREREVGGLVQERVEIRKGVMLGRKLVDYDSRLKLLEEGLLVDLAGKDAVDEFESEESEESDEDESEEGYSMSVRKLKKHAIMYGVLKQIEREVEEHPFITAQAPRMIKVRNTLLLDLNTALQQANSSGKDGKKRVLKILEVYKDMDESAEAIKALRDLKNI